MSDAPTAFLLARIAEDEAAAKAAQDGYRALYPRGWTIGRWGWWVATRRGNPYDLQAAEFDGAPSPRRVLAECEAKRRIVERYVKAAEKVAGDDRRVRAGGIEGAEAHRWDTSALEPVLRLLALPYADHPDYRQEWRP